MSGRVLRGIALAVAAGAVLATRACGDGREPVDSSRVADRAPGGPVEVLRVGDGDSIEVDRDGSPMRVRLIGIDAPEMTDTRPDIHALAAAAAEAQRRLLSGRRVRLEFDEERRDRYGRTLAYVYVGDTLVNEWLVRRGLARARAYPPNLRHQERLESAEAEARQANRGIWDGRLEGRPFRPPR